MPEVAKKYQPEVARSGNASGLKMQSCNNVSEQDGISGRTMTLLPKTDGSRLKQRKLAGSPESRLNVSKKSTSGLEEISKPNSKTDQSESNSN